MESVAKFVDRKALAGSLLAPPSTHPLPPRLQKHFKKTFRRKFRSSNYINKSRRANTGGKENFLFRVVFKMREKFFQFWKNAIPYSFSRIKEPIDSSENFQKN